MKIPIKIEKWRNNPEEVLRKTRIALKTPECEDIIKWALIQRHRSCMLTQNSKMISDFVLTVPKNKLKEIGKRILKFLYLQK